MLQTTSIDALRNQVAEWRRSGERIVLVPTMGNLHPGHHSLIQRARTLGSRVVATIFVNPTQFGPTEDFNSYPRTLAQDVVGLEAHGCDALFYPGVDDVYPFGLGASVSIAVPELGSHRGDQVAQYGSAGCRRVRAEGLSAADGDPQGGYGPADADRHRICCHCA